MAKLVWSQNDSLISKVMAVIISKYGALVVDFKIQPPNNATIKMQKWAKTIKHILMPK